MKKRISILLAVVLCLSLFAGCGGTEGTSGSTSAGPQSVKPSENGDEKQVTITWWEYPNFEGSETNGGAYEKEIIARFNEKHPNIKVNLEVYPWGDGPEKLLAAIKTGQAPDVVYDYPGRITLYARSGKMVQLDDMFTDKFKADVPDTILEACAYDGHYYNYPFNTAPFMMCFNKTMLEEMGLLDMLPLGRENRTWTPDEYAALMRAIREKDSSVYPAVFYCKNGEGWRSTLHLMLNMNNGQFMTQDLNGYLVDSPEMVSSLEWIAEMLDEGVYPPGAEGYTSNDAIDLFLQGKAASTLIYSSVLSNTFKEKKVGNFEEVFVPYPTKDAGDPQLEVFLGTFGIFDNGDPDKIEASKLFVDFLCNDPEMSKENLVKTGGLSVRKSVTGLYDSEETEFCGKMVQFAGQYANHAPSGSEASKFFVAAIQAVVGKQKTPADALKEFNELANQAAAEVGG